MRRRKRFCRVSWVSESLLKTLRRFDGTSDGDSEIPRKTASFEAATAAASAMADEEEDEEEEDGYAEEDVYRNPASCLSALA